MTPAPLSKVLKVVESATGNANQTELVELVNGVVEMLYRSPALTYLYFKVAGCACAEMFTEPCLTNAPRQFVGVVMPVQVKNIRELSADGAFFRLTDEKLGPVCWGNGNRHTQMGYEDPRAERLPLRMLERDIPCGDSRILTFRSDDIRDCGKLIGLRYREMDGTEQRIDIELGTGRVATETSVLEVLEITFPERRGWITVETDNGAFLGKYHPSVYIPAHEWFRLETYCAGWKIQYRGLQEPVPAVFPTDPIPFSDSPRWKLALKLYQNIDNMELTPGNSAAIARMANQLAAMDVADLANTNHNFTTAIQSESAKKALGVGRRFSQVGQFARSRASGRRIW